MYSLCLCAFVVKFHLTVPIHPKRGIKMELSGVTAILGGEEVLHKKIENQMDLIELSQTGIPKDALVNLAKYLSFTIRQMAELLTVTERTIQKYLSACPAQAGTPKKHFNRVVSEQILHIAFVAARGAEVFGERSQFLPWMNHPNKALANKTPMSLLRSRFGVEMVLDELGRMEYGVLS
jgi:putative toxin-antitoxin system antitoxin component (TIGR02293 family)